jgi:hypothetical protein
MQRVIKKIKLTVKLEFERQYNVNVMQLNSKTAIHNADFRFAPPSLNGKVRVR